LQSDILKPKSKKHKLLDRQVKRPKVFMSTIRLTAQALLRHSTVRLMGVQPANFL